MFKFPVKFIFPLVLLFLFLTGCATYYEKTFRYQEYIQNGQFDKANDWLSKDKKGKRPRDQMLHLFNQGWVDWILNKPEESNIAFEQADNLIEDQQKNLGYELLSLMSNPGIRPYQPEDFEKVMVNYFKALNYIKLNKLDEALVECRKINIKLNQLNDKYKDKKNRYSGDAFAQLMMGLIYDANRDYNNAFIAYRNAYETYESVYEKNFGVTAPEQLKKDLIRAAYRTGFMDEVSNYEQKFNMKYVPDTSNAGELVMLWHNGFGPVKSEWSINFTKVDGEGGWVTFANEEEGLNFPIYIGNMSDKDKSGFAQLDFVRIAFPKYTERIPLYDSAKLVVNNHTYPLQLAQNINEIAFKTLKDRMLRETATAILRLATKKAAELALRNNKQEDLGAALSLVNALTEKADTRNWQTLPYSISYARVPMPMGQDSISFRMLDSQNPKVETLKFDIKKKETRFFVYTSLGM